MTETYYIGPPYFSATEADTILHTVDETESGKTLKEPLDKFLVRKSEKRLESMMKETGDYRVCAAHDLAPIVEKAFHVHPKDLAKNKEIRVLVDTKGLTTLDQGGVWKGLRR